MVWFLWVKLHVLDIVFFVGLVFLPHGLVFNSMFYFVCRLRKKLMKAKTIIFVYAAKS